MEIAIILQLLAQFFVAFSIGIIIGMATGIIIIALCRFINKMINKK